MTIESRPSDAGTAWQEIVICDAPACVVHAPTNAIVSTGDPVADDLARMPYAWSVVTTPDGASVRAHHCPKHSGT